MIEEAAQHLARQVEDVETIHWLALLGGDIGQEQRERVSIAALGVPAQVAFLDQMIEEETLDPRAQQAGLRHAAPPVWRSVRSRDWPVEAVRWSWRGSVGCRAVRHVRDRSTGGAGAAGRSCLRGTK